MPSVGNFSSHFIVQVALPLNHHRDVEHLFGKSYLHGVDMPKQLQSKYLQKNADIESDGVSNIHFICIVFQKIYPCSSEGFLGCLPFSHEN